jgi:hypothetical protein
MSFFELLFLVLLLPFQLFGCISFSAFQLFKSFPLPCRSANAQPNQLNPKQTASSEPQAQSLP